LQLPVVDSYLVSFIGIYVVKEGKTYVPAGAKKPSFSFPGSVTFFKHPSPSCDQFLYTAKSYRRLELEEKE
jgi:hypothetical protein